MKTREKVKYSMILIALVTVFTFCAGATVLKLNQNINTSIEMLQEAR